MFSVGGTNRLRFGIDPVRFLDRLTERAVDFIAMQVADRRGVSCRRAGNRLVYVGKAGTGFTERSAQEVRARLGHPRH